MYKFLVSLFLICSISLSQVDAQNLTEKEKIDLELAIQYYRNKEYSEAIHYLERIDGKPVNRNVYHYLFESYLNTEAFKDAEKLVKKQIKSFPYNSEYQIDLGKLYSISGRQEDSQRQYEEVIKNMPESQHEVIKVSNTFSSMNELEFAEKALLKGRKKIKDYPFNFELANVYYLLQNYELMIQEYLNLLSENESYLQSVQNSLQSAITYSNESDLRDVLRQGLLRRIQKNPNRDVFAELLIWYYVQEQDFEGAFIQAKALDRRNSESGNRIVALARLSASNRDYETAVECYQYVIDKGPGARYHVSRKGLVNVYQEKIVNSKYTNEDLIELESLYKTTIDDLGLNAGTIDLAIGLSHLQAFYLQKPDSAIILLKKSLKLPGARRTDIAQAKIELGDIYIIKDEIWEASLLFSQVVSDFKYDELGEIAKFKNARVFYYSGDFNWAKGQLDVLKGSTSKLIANDAMELSLTISDNLTLDTNKTPLTKYARAELLINQNKTDKALAVLDSISYLFPGHSLSDEILFKKYEIYFKKREFSTSAIYLEKLFNEGNPRDILADNAIFLLAELNQFQLNNPERAMELYKKLLTDYSNSIYATEARNRFRSLRGDENFRKMQSEDAFFHGKTPK